MNDNRRVGLAALAILLLTNVGLLIAQLSPADSLGASSDLPALEVTSTPEPIATREALASPSRTGSPTDVAKPTPAGRWLLDAAEGGIALRARTGTCEQSKVVVARSTDAGRTWQTITPEGLRAVNGVEASARSGGWMVGAVGDCSLRFFESTSAGALTRSGTPDGTWFRLDESSNMVHTPAGIVPGPCQDGETVVDVIASMDELGKVLCSSGVIFLVSDNGRSWSSFGEVAGANSLSFATADVGYAAASTGDCDGVSVFRGVSGEWSALACVAGADASTAAISVVGEFGLLMSDAGTWRSTDGARTWTPVD